MIVLATALVIAQVIAFSIIQSQIYNIIERSIRRSQAVTAAHAVKVAIADPDNAVAHLVEDTAIVSAVMYDAPRDISAARRDHILEDKIVKRAGLSSDYTFQARSLGLDIIAEPWIDEPKSQNLEKVGPFTLLYCDLEIAPGRWLSFVVRPRVSFWPPPPPALITLAIGLATVTMFSVLAASRIARPFRDFTNAAERLTAGEPHAPVEVFGPNELRRAQTAFNVMAARLQATLSGQQALLGAIGHDLRTPITSLRLRAEVLGDETERDRMTRALDELQRLTEAALDAASGGVSDAPRQPIDLSSLIATVCDDLADIGQPVRMRDGEGAPIIEGWPGDLARALRNVIENAVRYGGGAHVVWSTKQTKCLICVEDDGPGLPEAELERVFQPLVRLEASRNANTGGHGLGLHITRNIITAHGGRIWLENRPEGGLKASIELPLA